jgi:hypothetical protein
MTRMTNDPGAGARRAASRRWQEPRLRFVGDVGEVLQGGGGKLSPTPGDVGEERVEKPHAPSSGSGS